METTTTIISTITTAMITTQITSSTTTSEKQLLTVFKARVSCVHSGCGSCCSFWRKRPIMDLFRELLCIILLLQLSEGNDEWETTPTSDSFAHYGEFCLRLPDSPHTSSETVQPSKSSARLPQPVTQPSDQPATEQITEDPTDSGKPISLIDGCRCKEEKDVLTDESLRLRQIKITSPHDSCHSVVLILTLKNNTEVCSQQTSSLLELYNKLKQSLVPEPVPFPSPMNADNGFPPVNPIEELPSTTPQTEPNLDPSSPTGGFNPDEEHIDRMHFPSFFSPPCESCGITPSLDSVDPTAVQSLDVKMTPFYCPLLMNITLKDGQVFCLDSKQPEFEAALMRLEMASSNGTDECRCEGREQKGSHRGLLRTTKIWPPSEACSSMEFIETLVNGSEVCVTAANISAYLKQATSDEADDEVLIERVPVSNRADHELLLKSEVETVDISDSVAAILAGETETVNAFETMCVTCYNPDEQISVDPKDVESVELTLYGPRCPVMLHVTLKNKHAICIDSDHSMFLSLLEKLDGPRV